MGLFKRISNIVKSKAEKVVSAAEAQDPVGIVKSQIQEAKKDLGDFESAVQDLGAQKHRLDNEVKELTAESKKWEKGAQAALSSENEELARKSLERKAEVDQQLVATKGQLKVADSNFEKAKVKLFEQKKYIEQKGREVSSLEARQKSAQANIKMTQTMAKYEGNGNSIDQIEIFSDKVKDLENKAAACEEMDLEAKGEDIEAQLEDLAQDSAVDDALAKMKAKMAEKTPA
jgi:phage shock protein A